jgi:hypothetical protein
MFDLVDYMSNLRKKCSLIS